MADYSKLSVIARVSKNSDYSDPYIAPKLDPYESTSTTNGLSTNFRAQTAGSSFALSHFATVESLIVKNTDTTNYVDVVVTRLSAAATATQRIAAGKFAVFSDVDPATAITLTANSSDVECDIVAYGTMT